MLDTSRGKFLSLGKILASDFTRIRFSSAPHHIFPVYFFLPRPAVLTSEGDGWISLCSFADRRAGSTSVLVYFWVCVGARAQHNLCTKKNVAFGEILLLWLKVERETLGSCGL